MARMHWTLMVALGLLAVGCVPQDRYDALKLENDTLKASLQATESEAKAARADAEAQKQLIEKLSAQNPNFMGMIKSLQDENGALRSQLDDAQRRLTEALSRTGGTPIDAKTSSELAQLAQQHPDLVEYDASRGVLKFKSDVTFAVGSAELSAAAKPIVARFAQILNGGAAAGYDLRVEGHTDAQRVANPETIRRGHKDNWYLSAHRAITVTQELIGQGVRSGRLGVAGYAEQRPIADNASAAGMAKNRRVEVVILPTGGGRATVGGGGPRIAPPKTGLNKDTIDKPAPKAPGLNK